MTTGSARVARRLGWAGLVVGAALILTVITTLPTAGAATDTAITVLKATTAKASGTCGRASGPFTVHGTQVLGGDGQPFISYGMAVPDLVSPNWTYYYKLDPEKIRAAINGWCVNTIRLQVSQYNLLGPSGTAFDQAYMSEIESLVSLAESYHMVVVLNDNTLAEPGEIQNSQEAPTLVTEVFWRYMTRIYGSDPQVIFDLFNEPRDYNPNMTQDQEWKLWFGGGEYQGTYYSIGMEQLAQYVRNTLGARNLFWIEGPNYSVSFDGMTRHGALLHVSNVVYSVHHTLNPEDLSGWYSDFGYLVEKNVAPVVEGEFTNYEPMPSTPAAPPRNSCWPNASTAIPQFFQYLQKLGIGLDAYQLQPRYLIKSYSNLLGPNTINPATWSCVSNAESQPFQGAGALVLNWFRQQNG